MVADNSDALVEENAALVTVIVADYREAASKRRIDDDELTQSGMLGLILASRHFDPDEHPGVPFGAYAPFWIRSELSKCIAAYPELLTGRNLDRRAAPPKPPNLVPMFGVLPFTPTSECPHRIPIARGSIFVCAKCHQSGFDHLKILQRDPRTDPKPESKLKAYRPDPAHKAETRKQRRARLYGHDLERSA